MKKRKFLLQLFLKTGFIQIAIKYIGRKSRMASVDFLLQGLNATEDHYAAVEQLLRLPNISYCLIGTAFMNSAGAAMVVDKLSAIAPNLQLIVGVRNGVTSKQSIEILKAHNIYPICVDTATQAFIFHPKVYLAHNQTNATLIIGSANLTSGGFVKNIESSAILNLDLFNQEDLLLMQKVINNFNLLVNQYPQNIFQLNDTFDLDEMVRQGILVDETRLPRRVNAHAQVGQGRTEQRPVMHINTRRMAPVQSARAQNVVNIPIQFTNVAIGSIINNQLLWRSGPLTRRDLNIPIGTNTHATGSMLLKVGDPSQHIDQRHYFRDVVFTNAQWLPDSNPQYSHIERCFVRFRVIIKGIDYGIHELRLSHNTRTDTETYRQNNSITQIHWGENIKPLIAHDDLLGGILCIYGPDAGTDIYTLTFDIE